MIGDPRKRAIAAALRYVVMNRAAGDNGHAQQAAQPRHPIPALAQAVVAPRQEQLAPRRRLGDLAHDGWLVRADRRDTEQRVADLRPRRRGPRPRRRGHPAPAQ
jgi:hypothetical protein